MNKVWKLAKKKAQYEERIRALERRIITMQDIVEGQHRYIQYLQNLVGASERKAVDNLDALVFTEPSNEGVIIVDETTELSTTPTLGQSPDSQTPTLPQSPIDTETNPELTDQVLETLVLHTERAPEQST